MVNWSWPPPIEDRDERRKRLEEGKLGGRESGGARGERE
jgi:hypothetical protein